MEIDTFNFALVGVQGDKIRVLQPLEVTLMTHERALVLAAWLVALTDPLNERFPAVLAAVEAT